MTERLALLVSLDAGGAIKGLESVGRAADRNLGRAESKLDKMGQKFQKAGVGMLAGAGLAATGLYKAGKAAADLEQAVGGTEAVFKDTSGVIDRFAKSSAKNMGLSERAFREATTSIGGQLKGLGFTVEDAADQAIDLTGVAADLAATYGGTTAEAVTALGAAFRGEADPAERFNLFLNQNRVNAKAVALGLAETTSSVDANAKAQAVLALITEQSSDALGQFARETGTAAGQMQIASAEFENAKAALGGAVAPIMATVAGGLADVAGGFTAANEASDGLISKLATFGTIGLGAAGGLSFITGKVISMRENLGTLAGPLRKTEGGLNKLGKAAAGLGLAGVVYGLVQMARAASRTVVDVDRAADALAGLSDAEEEQLQTSILAAESYGKLDEMVRQLADGNVIAAERFVEVAEAAGLSHDRIVELNQIVNDKRAGDVQGAKDQEEYAKQIGAATGPTDDLAEATGTLTDRLKDQADAYDGLLDAVLSQFDADIGYRRSLGATADALDDVKWALAESGPKSKEYTRALLDAEDALLDQADAAVRLYEDTVKANGGTLTATEKTALYKGKLEELAAGLEPGSPLRTALDGYIWQLSEVPATVGTKILADTSGAFQSVAEFLAYLDTVGAKGVTGHTMLLGFKQEQMLARAGGGPVSAHTPYMVGEEGPELFMPARSGTIVPNSQLGGGAVSQSNTWIINNPLPEKPSESLRAARREAALMGA